MSLIYIISKMLSDLSGSGPQPTPIGEFINDTFSGSSLSADWDAPGGQTISVSGGVCHIVGSGSTKDTTKSIKNIGYGSSTLRNYDVEIGFKINSIGANTKGVFVGVESSNNNSFNFSSYGLIDFSTSTGNALELIFTNELGVIGNGTSSTTSMPAINTSDTYSIKLTVLEGQVKVTFTNVTASTTKISTLTYDFTNNSAPLRPNIFNYSFGVAGSSDVDILYFKATTTENRNPKIVFVGDSITVGYSAGNPINSYAYKLRAFTTDDIQVMAGGGNNILHVIDNLPEILSVDPEIVFLMIGTNSGGTFTDYQTIYTTLTNAGKIVYPLLLPNKGNPSGGGDLNESIATTYPSAYIDNWTIGWDTMTIGNGEMHDALHPTNTGDIKQANIIKAAKPIIFPI